jgi:acyl-[acyl-carrier-protein]-phospholipid O-acyltransferase/long-chain-fatty-acid--[acyl-carrier-protein] ligase
VRRLLQIIFKLLFRLRLVNFENLQFNGPSVIIPNHVSFIDPVILYLFLPREVVFVVNTHIAKRFAFVLRFCHHVDVDPLNPYSLKKIAAIVKTGTPVVLFPEGRITVTGGLMKVYDGIGFIAQKTGAALYPLIFTGLEYSKSSRVRDKLKSRWFPRVRLFADQPVKLKADETKTSRMQKRELSNKILQTMQQSLFRAKYEEKVNLFNNLLQAAQTNGTGSIIAEDMGQKISYRNLLIGSYVLAKKLSGLLKDENIGVLLPNSIGHVVTLFSLFFNGKTPAVLNFSAGVKNNLDCAETAGIGVVLTSRVFIEKGDLNDLAEALAKKYNVIYLEDIKKQIGFSDKLNGLIKYLVKAKAQKPTGRVILFTSGSESKPKGVVLSHSNIAANIRQISCVIDFTPKDRIFNALPMFHSFGLTAGTMLPLLSGVEVFLYPSPLHYKIIPELCYEKRATVIFGTSTFLASYGKYAHPYDFFSLRLVLAGAEKLKEDTRVLWQDKFGIRILEGYGTTETAPVLSLNTPLFYKEGTVGRLLPGVSWQLETVEGIEEGGSLLVQGPNVMEGYLLHGVGFVPAPVWYNCGDVVSIDREGFVAVKSRLKRFAKVSGEMVSLNLVEELAEKCFGIAGQAAVNMPDSRKGEKIILYTSDKKATRQQLRDYLARSHQSMLLMPAEVEYIEKLPLLGSGKTDYVALKQVAEKRNLKD